MSDFLADTPDRTDAIRLADAIRTTLHDHDTTCILPREDCEQVHMPLLRPALRRHDALAAGRQALARTDEEGGRA